MLRTRIRRISFNFGSTLSVVVAATLLSAIVVTISLTDNRPLSMELTRSDRRTSDSAKQINWANYHRPVSRHEACKQAQSTETYKCGKRFTSWAESTATATLLIAVVSRPDQFARRQFIRKLWGGRRVFRTGSNRLLPSNTSRVFALRTLFFVGAHLSTHQPSTPPPPDMLFDDIVTLTVFDDYRNLTVKTFQILNYVHRHCPPSVRLMLKVDEDIFLNMPRVQEVSAQLLRTLGGWSGRQGRSERSVAGKGGRTGRRVDQFANQQLLLAGNCRYHDQPVRDVASKYFISPDIYPAERFPPFCSGVAYFLARPMLAKIVQTECSVERFSDSKPLFPLEDVQLGITAARIGVVPHWLDGVERQGHLLPLNQDYVCQCVLAYHAELSPEEWQRLWRYTNGEQCAASHKPRWDANYCRMFKNYLFLQATTRSALRWLVHSCLVIVLFYLLCTRLKAFVFMTQTSRIL